MTNVTHDDLKKFAASAADATKRAITAELVARATAFAERDATIRALTEKLARQDALIEALISGHKQLVKDVTAQHRRIGDIERGRDRRAA